MMARIPSRALEGLLYALTLFGPLAFGCVEPWSRGALEIGIFALALACFLRGRRELPPMATWFWLFAAAFAAFAAFQGLTPVAADLPWPQVPFTAAPSATRDAVLLWTAYAALLWSVPQAITTHQAARRYCYVLFGLGAGLAAQGLLQAATGGGKLYWYRATELTGVFGPYYNRDHAANFLLMTLAVGVGVFFSKRRDWPAVDGPPSEYVRSQSRLAAVAALIFAGLVACASRGAFLAMPLSALLVVFVSAGFAKSAKARRLRAGAALAVAAFVVFFCYRMVGLGAEAGAMTDLAITERFYIYGDAWRWLRDAPFFGTGAGSFSTVYPSYQDLDLRGLAEHAHSDWLELVLETGLAGLLAALAAAACLGVGAARAWYAAGSREMRALIGGALGAVAAFAAHSLFEFGFQIPGNAVIFLGLAGFLLSAPLWADKAAPQARPVAPAAWAAAAALACFLGLSRAVLIPGGEPDPRSFRGLASRLYERFGAVERPDASGLRDALALSLAAVELRPYDYKTLGLAGMILQRLGREDDARVLLERSRLVRFTPVVIGAGDDHSGSEAKKLSALKSLGLLPRRLEKP